ncbi:MAG: hypothetical protein LQ352_006787 [Teloschistes flavicans]|nr:MAG: hypothetical protein LQ352_006787 [Teloschistes flavicans]
MSRPVFHVAIVGAGLGGLAAAIGIAKAGHKIIILERASALSEPPNASRIMKRWGLLDAIEAVSVRPAAFILRSYHDGTVLSTENLGPFAEQRYGVPYLHIHRADYHKILVQQAKRLGVTILLDSKITDIDFEKPSVLLGRGKGEIRADIILGADGLRSLCREAMLRRPDPPQATGDLVYRIILDTIDMQRDPSLRALAEKPVSSHYWLGPQSHVVCYFLKGGELCNLVLACPDNLPHLTDTAEANLQELRDFFQEWDPRLRALLGMVKQTSKWRLLDSEEMETWSHPTQGAAQAVEDGAVLGKLFELVEQPAQLPDVLGVYERLRKPRTTTIVKRSTAIQDVFHLADGPVQQARDRQMLYEKPCEGHPNPFADPALQSYLYDYDAFEEADKAWVQYTKHQSGLCNVEKSVLRSKL